MSRQEKILVAIAALLLLVAMWIVFSMSQPHSSASDDTGIPWSLLLWQLGHQLAPPFAVTGLACAVGILFFRAASWDTRTGSERDHTVHETAEQSNGTKPGR